MPKKIATLLLSIAAIGPMALPVQAVPTANSMYSSSNIADCKSNLIAQGPRQPQLSLKERQRLKKCARFKADCISKGNRGACDSFQKDCLKAGPARR